MNQSLMERMKVIRERFLKTIPPRLDEVSALIEPAGGTQPDPDALARMHRILHEISGTAGTLGAGEVTRALEPAFTTVEACREAGRAPDSRETLRIKLGVDEAKTLANTRTEDPIS